MNHICLFKFAQSNTITQSLHRRIWRTTKLLKYFFLWSRLILPMAPVEPVLPPQKNRCMMPQDNIKSSLALNILFPTVMHITEIK